MKKYMYGILASVTIMSLRIESSLFSKVQNAYQQRRNEKAGLIVYEEVSPSKRIVLETITPGLSAARILAENKKKREENFLRAQAEYRQSRFNSIVQIDKLLGGDNVECDRKADRSWLGVSSTQGPVRGTMEDAHSSGGNDKVQYASLFDGSCGHEISEFAARYCKRFLDKELSSSTCFERKRLASILWKCCADVEKSWYKHREKLVTKSEFGTYEAGSTALISLFTANMIAVANIGDSRAVLCYGDKAIDLSVDHKPYSDSERKRIEAANGMVSKVDDVFRVNGTFATSRSLGKAESLANLPMEYWYDLDKSGCRYYPWVIAEPELYFIKKSDFEDIDFCIMACDGVWDVISSRDAVKYVKKCLSENGRNLQKTAYALQQEVIQLGSQDNVTVMIIDLKKKS